MNGNFDTLSVQYKTDVGENSDNNSTSDRDGKEDIGESTGNKEYAELVLTAGKKNSKTMTESGKDIIAQRLSRLRPECLQKMMNFF